MKKNIFPTIIPLIIVILTASSRLLDHPANFTPVVAMSIFAGCYLRSKWAVLMPVAAMLASDYFIGFYEWQVMAAVYGSIAAAYGIGMLLGKKMSWYYVLAGSLVSSIIFFLVTNFAVWVFFDWYSHDMAGLLQCYTLALPFFRNSIVGDVLYSGILFGGYEWTKSILQKNKVAVRI